MLRNTVLAILLFNSFLYTKELKLLVLIIASDQAPIFVELQKKWQAYMHADPEHVEAYFIKCDSSLSEPFSIKGDTIWSKGIEGYCSRSSGILDKTILSIEAMLPRLYEFDYVLRTNLSSFYLWDKLFVFLKSLPKTGCLAGSSGAEANTTSGCGFIMSPDIAELLVKHKSELLGLKYAEDDVIFGRFFNQQGLTAIHHPRADILCKEQWEQIRNYDLSSYFHFRVKNLNDSLRIKDDLPVYQELLERFYIKK